MEYAALSRYNIFSNQIKEMSGKMAIGVGGCRKLIGGFIVSELGRLEDGNQRF